MELVEVQLLGRFGVTVDGRAVADDAWARRGAELVKLLALTPGHVLHRERVVEAIWPELAATAGFRNLHKAAHLARRATVSSAGSIRSTRLGTRATGRASTSPSSPTQNSTWSRSTRRRSTGSRGPSRSRSRASRLRRHGLTSVS